MHVALVMVASLNDKNISKPQDRTPWVSPEDQKMFSELKTQYPVLVMGRKTYESVEPQIVPSPSLLRIVLTHHPEKYASHKITGQLEFSSESPKILVDRLVRAGYASMLVAGGPDINALFASAGLLDSIHLTLEPVIIGSGRPFISHLPVNLNLRLEKLQQLNERGTLHLVYNVIK